MKVGYARTSTTDQDAGFEAQIRDLNAAGCERIFSEQVSSVAKREHLEDALTFIREGDIIMVTRLDRLARSVKHLLEIVDRIQDKGASLRILDMNLDTSTATGRMILQVVGSIAEFERRILLERQREGIAYAKAKGKYKGREPTAMRQKDTIFALTAQGMGPTHVAAHCGIDRKSVYRVLATFKGRGDGGTDGSRAT